jgi:CBS domain-containing protein
MTSAIISAEPSTTLFQIAKMMEHGGMGAIFIKKDGKPSAVITDRDYAIKIAVNRLPLDTPVEKIASSPLQTIDSKESILTAAKTMTDKKIRKLAVTEQDVIVGIITSTDLVSHLAKS